MSTPAQKHSNFIAGLADQGVDWLPNLVLGAGATQAQPQSMCVTSFVASTTTYTLNIVTEFGAAFVDTGYHVLVSSDQTGSVGWASKAAGSIQFTGLTASEQVSVCLIGKLTNQS